MHQIGTLKSQKVHQIGTLKNQKTHQIGTYVALKPSLIIEIR